MIPGPANRRPGAPGAGSGWAVRALALLAALEFAQGSAGGGILAIAGAVHRAQAAAPALPAAFTNFEIEPVRPLALSPDGSRLFVLNGADNRLEVWTLDGAGPTKHGEVFVGLRPVAVAVRTSREVWVSNHLSDAVSVVDTSDVDRPQVVATFPVGDEPRDIVVAGPKLDKVFVATARRTDPTTPGLPRAELWVFDLGGRLPLSPTVAVVPLFGTKPRGLAVSADRRTVYAAIFKSGNRTTAVHERIVNAAQGKPLALAPPPTGAGSAVGEGLSRFIGRSGLVDGSFMLNADRSIGPGQDRGRRRAYPLAPAATPTLAAPPVSVIAQELGRRWLDDQGRDWTAAIPFHLPDSDVFQLDASAWPPSVSAVASGVGTVLFNLAARPNTDEVWVTNTEARNTERFEPVLKGRAVESRVTRVTFGLGAPQVAVVPLNPHLGPNGHPPSPPGPAERAQSLAQPTDLVFSRDGSRAYVAAFLSGKVGVLDGNGRVQDRIAVGFGPGGLALDEARRRLYVLNHLDATLAVVNLDTRAVYTRTLTSDPTPAFIHAGRRLLYDAEYSSAGGDQACASCHVFGDDDGLAWDLGDPGGSLLPMPFGITHDNFLLKPQRYYFHPEKGPMLTQSLRGLAGAGIMHWRGDRFGAEPSPNDEAASFMQFRGAFESLLGRDTPVPDADMKAFAQFALSVRYPPNPYRRLDNSLTDAAKAGEQLFGSGTAFVAGVSGCAGCHALPLGTNGRVTLESQRSGQDFKVPHLRNLYQRVGRFDAAGDQVSGFGFGHDGAIDTLASLLSDPIFVLPGDSPGKPEPSSRAKLADFLLGFHSGLAPAVGKQVTFPPQGGGASDDSAVDTLTLLAGQASQGACELVAFGELNRATHGWLFVKGGFYADVSTLPSRTPDSLVADHRSAGSAVTFVCVPPGEGRRTAIDRDMDDHLNGDETAAGTDPLDPASRPADAVPTRTISPTPSNTPTRTPTRTPSTTLTPTPRVSPSLTPSISPTPSRTPRLTAIPTVAKTATPLPTVTPTPAATITPNATPTPTVTPRPASATPTATPSRTQAAPTVTMTPDQSPTAALIPRSTPEAARRLLYLPFGQGS